MKILNPFFFNQQITSNIESDGVDRLPSNFGPRFSVTLMIGDFEFSPENYVEVKLLQSDDGINFYDYDDEKCLINSAEMKKSIQTLSFISNKRYIKLSFEVTGTVNARIGAAFC